MIKDRTGATPVPVNFPIGAENKLEGIVDLITMEEWVWQGEDLGASWVCVSRSATELQGPGRRVARQA
jgi:elongation factor G